MKKFFTYKHAQLRSRSLEVIAMITLSWLSGFLVSWYLFRFACFIRGGFAAGCFGFVAVICGVRFVLGVMAFEARLMAPQVYRNLSPNRPATGREFKL